ncbi:MAG: bifunctional UDP-3-O-[3-hydroxymyristoyl] N-acetylglucosamine deacetylase/3-hydroxyacyl-ACP dehydratase [Salinivirgaceae bacterium]|nr:bifunctional UDP-3-O-[3-hydroxymyristoyl] N-acetylglucosamine deacetylase/3-hydroxyacyl-ACP dehydratase [Salinivirgaceae bacterium]
MKELQHTLKESVTFKGLGIHTGHQVTMVVHPAPDNHGVVFSRSDIDKENRVPALADNVVDTSRGTTISKNDITIHTIEHLMAALHGMKIDNVLIELDADEIPIMDGSSVFFIKKIKETGIEEQKEERQYFVVKEKIEFSVPDKGIEIAIYPDDHFSVDVMIEYNSKVLGHQYASMPNIEEFAENYCEARTFAFWHELEFLFNNNLIKGGSLDNAIVVVEHEVPQADVDRLAGLFNKPSIEVKEGYLNNLDLKYPNEPARHKLLDLVGDFYLIGRPIKGKVIAKRPGHFANTEVAKIIRNEIKKNRKKLDAPVYNPAIAPVYDVVRIQETLPHRPPFLLVDKIIHLDQQCVTGVKNVTMNEPFFVGHFPGSPVMPGVLQIEAMAQVGGILVLNTVEDPENYLTYFLKIDGVKFKKMVVPGDTLIFHLELVTPIRRGLAHMKGKAWVGDTVVMEAELMAQISKVKNN